MPFTDYVHHVVLGSWGWTAPDSATGPDRATGYIRAPRITDPLLRRLLPHGIAGDRKGPFLALNPFYLDGPAYGGLIGDVVDASRFLRMHLNDGELDGNLVLAPRGSTISVPAQASGRSCACTRTAVSVSISVS